MAIGAIEVQVISRILTSQNESDINTLLSYDSSYFSAYSAEIKYIQDRYAKYSEVPSIFDFQVEFPEFTIVQVPESMIYLQDKLRENKRRILLVNTFNKLKDLGEGDVTDAWRYLEAQCDLALTLSESDPLDLVRQAEERAEQVKEYSKQKRIPTGFPEIDKAMYGGLSTVEELLILIARTNSGKSWVCARMMESAQKNGFPVAYYSPEMQGAFLATRFDTWRGHFANSSLFKGEYSNEYLSYIHKLMDEGTSAFIIEDKDYPEGVSVRALDPFVKKHGIKLLIIDGISYMKDDEGANTTQDKYKHIAQGLFQLSKKYGCACVLVMQANREVQNKDDKGVSIPDLFNAEGSDQPARIATQAFGIRQIFEKHVLDIKLLKSRMANNQNPVFSYAWDINTGAVNYIDNPDDDYTETAKPEYADNTLNQSIIPTNFQPDSNDMSLLTYDDDEDVEF